MYTSVGSPCMWEGPMHVSMRVCVYVCVDSFRKGELWLLAGCYPALPSHLGCVCSRQLLSRRLHSFFYEASLSLTQMCTHARSAGLALYSSLYAARRRTRGETGAGLEDAACHRGMCVRSLF